MNNQKVTDNLQLVALACVVGFIGDALLQLGVKIGMGGPTGWGLKEYFLQHGKTESLFIAAGMMALFYIVYFCINVNFSFSIVTLSLYGILVDYIFRKTMLFDSLKGYYTYLNYFWSAVWIVIPLLIPYILLKLKVKIL